MDKVPTWLTISQNMAEPNDPPMYFARIDWKEFVRIKDEKQGARDLAIITIIKKYASEITTDHIIVLMCIDQWLKHHVTCHKVQTSILPSCIEHQKTELNNKNFPKKRLQSWIDNFKQWFSVIYRE